MMNIALISLLALCGVVLIVFGLIRFKRTHNARAWLPVPATIIDSRISSVKAVSEVPHLLYFPEVRFRYETSEGIKQGHRFSIFPNDYQSDHALKTEHLLRAYPVGKDTTAYVCPTDSSLAVLCPQVSKTMMSHNYALLASGILVLAACLAAAYYATIIL